MHRFLERRQKTNLSRMALWGNLRNPRTELGQAPSGSSREWGLSRWWMFETCSVQAQGLAALSSAGPATSMGH